METEGDVDVTMETVGTGDTMQTGWIVDVTKETERTVDVLLWKLNGISLWRCDMSLLQMYSQMRSTMFEFWLGRRRAILFCPMPNGLGSPSGRPDSSPPVSLMAAIHTQMLTIFQQCLHKLEIASN